MAIKIFLDTNVYETTNFSFSNRKFSKLRNLILNDEVTLLYNSIVYQEVYQHIEDNLAPAVNQYNQVINENRAFAPFRGISGWGNAFIQLEASEMICALRKQWDEYLEGCFAEEIEISTVDVEEIIDKYFKKLPPFERKKPYEFKDAIIIDSIRQYALANPDDKIYVVSHDKGFRKSFRNDHDILVFSELNKALNKAIQEEENISIELEGLFNDEIFKNKVLEDIAECAYSGEISVEDIFDEIDVIKTECVDLQFEYVDSVETDHAVIIATASFLFTVEYSELDEDRSYYDREDSRWYWEVYNKFESEFITTKELEIHILLHPEHEDPDSLFEYGEIAIDNDFYLKQNELVNKEVLETISGDFDNEYDASARYCPGCGCKLTYENDAGAFCINCAPDH